MPTVEELVKLLDLQRVVSEEAVASRQLERDRERLQEILKTAAHPANRDLLEAHEALEQHNRREVELRADIDIATKRLDRDEQLVQTTSDHKQIARLQAEQERLRERIDELETRQLEELEARDEVAARVATLEETVSNSKSEQDLRKEDAQRAIDLSLEKVSAARISREGVEQTIAPELLEAFNEAKASNGLVGAERIIERGCPTVGLPLGPDDYQMIADAALDELVHCPECGAIVVKGSLS